MAKTTVTPADVRGVAPQYAGTWTDQLLQSYCERAGRQVNGELWGEEAVTAAALLAAHLFAMENDNLVGSEFSQVASISIGPISKSFVRGSAASAEDCLDDTRWGREYNRMRRQMGCFAMVL